MVGLTPGACCDCGSTATTCVLTQWRYCVANSAAYNLVGYTVRAVRTSDGVELASGVTNASGQVTLCVPNGQTFRWYLDGGEWFGAPSFPGGYFSGFFTVTPLEEYACWFNGAGGVCTNAPYFHKRLLTLTDANGSYGFDVLSGETVYLYQSYANAVIPDGMGGCTIGAGTVRYWYNISRTNSGWSISRVWDTALGLYDKKPASLACAESLGSVGGTFTNSSCPDVFVSGSPSEGLPGYTDPVGGTVVLSS